MRLYDGMSVHTMAVRLFILERGGLKLDIASLDVQNLENRNRPYLKVNPRGEVPALQLDDGTVLTEIPAVCEYLDEIAQGGTSLFGSTPLERAQTRMWLRRMDLEISLPLIEWWRNDPATVDFYRGHRIPIPEARMYQKVRINQALNMLERDLEGKQWLCGDRFSAADTQFYGLTRGLIASGAEWVLHKGRKNVVAYFERMDKREASKTSAELFLAKVEVGVNG